MECSHLRATETKCHTLRALNSRNFSSPSSGGWRSEIQVSAGLGPSSPLPASGRCQQTWHYLGNLSQGAVGVPGSCQRQEERIPAAGSPTTQEQFRQASQDSWRFGSSPPLTPSRGVQPRTEGKLRRASVSSNTFLSLSWKL